MSVHARFGGNQGLCGDIRFAKKENRYMISPKE